MKLDDASSGYARTVADAIKRRREEAGLSMNKLSESAGLSQPMIGLIERNVHKTTIDTLFRIAHGLGTTPAALLAEVESSPKPLKQSAKSVKPVATKSAQVKKRPKPLA